MNTKHSSAGSSTWQAHDTQGDKKAGSRAGFLVCTLLCVKPANRYLRPVLRPLFFAVDFFAVDFFAVDFFAALLRAPPFFAALLRAPPFFAALLRAPFFAAPLRAPDFFAALLRPPFFAAAIVSLHDGVNLSPNPRWTPASAAASRQARVVTSSAIVHHEFVTTREYRSNGKDTQQLSRSLSRRSSRHQLITATRSHAIVSSSSQQ